jgi:hypothetical protein
MIIATVIIFALLIHSVLEFKEVYKESGIKAALPLLIYIIALANSFWSPLRISSDIFRSRIVYRAYRREQYGHAQIKMREGGAMDIRYPGPFGMADWEYGQWRLVVDTFYLTYDKPADTIASKPDTLIRTSGGLLKPLGIPDDTFQLYKDKFFRIPISRKR